MKDPKDEQTIDVKPGSENNDTKGTVPDKSVNIQDTIEVKGQSKDKDDSQQQEIVELEYLHEEAEDNAGVVPIEIKDKIMRDLKEWDRYQILALLGEGGMGKVYKAYDPKLKRYVALKFLRGDDPELLKRFMQEAHTQARVEHEHICKVYEVGDVAGKAYIAMQYIEGKNLSDAATMMSLEQRIEVMRKVAEALHAAHRSGLIHRDVKPSNIMVEHTEEGEWKPYVMDFGLARESEAQGITLSGIIMGTPAYMSPEQARGEIHDLDRRTDVYSLGATLYDILAGKQPFAGTTPMDIMMKVINDDPILPRKANPAIPYDLETIIMKCMEKERHLRYDSAKAFADDLKLYLDGEPIKAIPHSLSYRLIKKIKKHKSIAAIVTVAFMAVLILAIIAFQTWLSSAKKAQIAQQFGSEIERMESLMRQSYMVPLHDIRKEKSTVLQKIALIKDRMKQIGAASEGPGNYAIGRGYLALHDYKQAQQYLELAWKEEYRESQVAYALGLVMGALYQEALANTERISDEKLRQKLKQEAESNYRNPALTYLKSSSGVELDSPAYAEGLIAYYEKRYDDALKKARQACQDIVWLYEAKKLEGDIYATILGDLKTKGDFTQALVYLSKSEASYRAAAEIAHSDASIYEGLCDALWNGIDIALYQGGGNPQQDFDKAITACSEGLVADPDKENLYILKARVYKFWSRYQGEHGNDPRRYLEESISILNDANKLFPRNSEILSSLGSSYSLLFNNESEQGGDPGNFLEQAIQNLESALKLDPSDASSYMRLGSAYGAKAQHELLHGKDPHASIEKAIYYTTSSLKITLDVNVYNNSSLDYTFNEEYEMETGQEPKQSFENAIKNTKLAIELIPNDPFPYAVQARAYRIYATYRVLHNMDPSDLIRNAYSAADKAIRSNPDWFDNYIEKGYAQLIECQYKVNQKENPEKQCLNAIESLKKSIQINPGDLDSNVLLGTIQILLAQYQLHHGLDPSKQIQAAKISIAASSAASPKYNKVFLLQSKLSLLQAILDIKRKQSPSHHFEEAENTLEQAKKLGAWGYEVTCHARHLSRYKSRLRPDVAICIMVE